LNDLLITWAGFSRANERLEHMKTVERREITERIGNALLTETNAGESADYLEAREEQARLEQRIAQLERRLINAKIVEPNAGDDVIDVGERVRLHEIGRASCRERV